MKVEEQLKNLVINALAKSKGNRNVAAKTLGVCVKSIQNYIYRFDLLSMFPTSTFVTKYGKERTIEIANRHKKKGAKHGKESND